MQTTTYFEVKNGKGAGGGLVGKNSKYTFDTRKEAVEMAKEFKANPRSHNPDMTDENVQYWSSRTYVVVKKTVTTEELDEI